MVGAACAWRSQVGGVGMSEPAGLAVSLPARCCFCNPVFLLKLIIWCFCCKKFLCNFYTLAKVSFFYWAAENSCFLPRLNRSYTQKNIC
jgi:hypothetical protein